MDARDQILASAKSAAVTTLADVRAEQSTSAAVIDALLSSNVVALLLECDGITLETLPWPPIPRQFEAQLEVLWHRYECAAADRDALRSAFDRIAAELYELTIDDLMKLQKSQQQ